MATESPAPQDRPDRSINARNFVETLLERLESGGLNGIYVWFAGKPNAVIKRIGEGVYAVLLWREGVILELVADDGLNVKYSDIHYCQETAQE